MAWFWKSSPKENIHRPRTSECQNSEHSNTSTQSPSPLQTSCSSTPTSVDPEQQTREEHAFQDLKSILTDIDPQRSERAASAARIQAETKPDVVEDSLYDSNMSCSQCWDLAYQCNGMGGQLRNVYRYGGLRSCHEWWAQWRFCMRTKAMSEDTRRVKIREWNQKKALKYKMGRSSEDVWETRDEAVEKPFSKAHTVVAEREALRAVLTKARDTGTSAYWESWDADDDK